MSHSRTSLDSESNFSLVDESVISASGRRNGGPSWPRRLGSMGSSSSSDAAAARASSYSISSIMALPQGSGSTTAAITANLSNLNPLRSTTGPKTGSTRGTAAKPIVLSDLPKVSRRDFEAYIESIRADYTAWSKVQSALADRPILEDLDDDDDDDDGHQLSEEEQRRKKAIARALDSSSLLLRSRSSSGGAGAGGRSQAGNSKNRRRNELPPLSEIPQLFFEENFNLAHPRTFDTVTSLAGRPVDMHKDDSSEDADQMLQEQLSHYLDIVEVHLSVEISMRSASFFSALSNLQALDTQSIEALKEIASLKEMLSEVDETVAQRGLKAHRSSVKRRRLNELDEAIDRIKEVLEALEQASEMVEAGESDGALDLIEALEREWQDSLQARPILTEVFPTDGPRLQTESVTAPQSTASNALTVIGEESMSIGDEANVGTGAQQEKEEEDRSLVRLRPPKTPLTAVFGRGQQQRQSSGTVPVRIAKIEALAFLPAQLSTLRVTVAHTLEQEFVAVLVHEFRESLERYRSAPEAYKKATRQNSENDSGGMSTGQPEHEAQVQATFRVTSVLASLVRCGKPALDGAIAAWRMSMMQELRTCLRSIHPSATSAGQDDDAIDSGESTPARRSVDGSGRNTSITPPIDAATSLKSMSHQDYKAFLTQVHTALLGCITVAEEQAQIVTRTSAKHLEERRRGAEKPSEISSTVTALGNSGSGAALDDAWIASLRSDLSDAVQGMAELSHIRLAKIIAARSDEHARLELQDFVQVFEMSWKFILDSELVSRRMVVGLRGVLVAQSKAFLQHFHQRKLGEAARQLENEQWSPVDVPASVQKLVQVIVDSAIQNPVELSLSASQNTDTLGSSNVEAPSKMVTIEDRTYYAVPAVLRSLEALVEYLKVVVNMTQLTTDVMSKIVEFLKQFNSRTCQVVLGAGAMRSAGLKNITAKHLALASQALSIMINLIPYIRECLRRHLRAKQAVILVDFDKLKRDYQEHQNEIHAKLVAIMGDRLAVHCKTLQSIDWEKEEKDDKKVDGPQESSSGKPNAYMETLVKEASTLHRVLLKYLPGPALELVMMQVLSAINSRLADEYSRIEIRSEAAKLRILEDARYMRSKFSELKGLERPAPGAELEDLIRMKRIEAVPHHPPAPPTKTFSTPSLTRPRGSFSSSSGHVRTPSATLVSANKNAKAEQQQPQQQGQQDDRQPPKDTPATEDRVSVSVEEPANAPAPIESQADEAKPPPTPEKEIASAQLHKVTSGLGEQGLSRQPGAEHVNTPSIEDSSVTQMPEDQDKDVHGELATSDHLELDSAKVDQAFPASSPEETPLPASPTVTQEPSTTAAAAALTTKALPALDTTTSTLSDNTVNSQISDKMVSDSPVHHHPGAPQQEAGEDLPSPTATAVAREAAASSPPPPLQALPSSSINERRPSATERLRGLVNGAHAGSNSMSTPVRRTTSRDSTDSARRQQSPGATQVTPASLTTTTTSPTRSVGVDNRPLLSTPTGPTNPGDQATGRTITSIADFTSSSRSTAPQREASLSPSASSASASAGGGGASSANVKNRLASLFNKRPQVAAPPIPSMSMSMPRMSMNLPTSLPKMSVPTSLPKVNLPSFAELSRAAQLPVNPAEPASAEQQQQQQQHQPQTSETEPEAGSITATGSDAANPAGIDASMLSDKEGSGQQLKQEHGPTKGNVVSSATLADVDVPPLHHPTKETDEPVDRADDDEQAGVKADQLSADDEQHHNVEHSSPGGTPTSTPSSSHDVATNAAASAEEIDSAVSQQPVTEEDVEQPHMSEERSTEEIMRASDHRDAEEEERAAQGEFENHGLNTDDATAAQARDLHQKQQEEEQEEKEEQHLTLDERAHRQKTAERDALASEEGRDDVPTETDEADLQTEATSSGDPSVGGHDDNHQCGSYATEAVGSQAERRIAESEAQSRTEEMPVHEAGRDGMNVGHDDNHEATKVSEQEEAEEGEEEEEEEEDADVSAESIALPAASSDEDELDDLDDVD